MHIFHAFKIILINVHNQEYSMGYQIATVIELLIGLRIWVLSTPTSKVIPNLSLNRLFQSPLTVKLGLALYLQYNFEFYDWEGI